MPNKGLQLQNTGELDLSPTATTHYSTCIILVVMQHKYEQVVAINSPQQK
ncbi:Uncharacterised protein [Zhongshania aliphaticivorans]|nr:Uncharacterised protein [Zhongshania aliphaticivorans]